MWSALQPHWFTPSKELLVHAAQETTWASEPVQKLWGWEKISFPSLTQTTTPQLRSSQPNHYSTPGLLLNKERHKFWMLRCVHPKTTWGLPWNAKPKLPKCKSNCLTMFENPRVAQPNLLPWIKRFIHVQKGPIIWLQPKPNKFSIHSQNGPWQHIRYSNSLHARWSKVQIPVGMRFSAHFQTSPVAHKASYSGSFLGVMRMRGGINHLPPPSTKVKERIQLYIYSPSGLSWPVLGWSLLFLHTFSHHITYWFFWILL